MLRVLLLLILSTSPALAGFDSVAVYLPGHATRVFIGCDVSVQIGWHHAFPPNTVHADCVMADALSEVRPKYKLKHVPRVDFTATGAAPFFAADCRAVSIVTTSGYQIVTLDCR